MEEAVSENMLLGPAMLRRAMYMYGSKLPKAPDGQIGCGIGMGVLRGTGSLIPPNMSITRTGDKRIVDGVHIVFRMVPGSETPSEMNFTFLIGGRSTSPSVRCILYKISFRCGVRRSEMQGLGRDILMRVVFFSSRVQVPKGHRRT